MSPKATSNPSVLSELTGLPVGSWNSADFLRAREALGMTQAELAATIDYDRSAIAKIEAGDAAPRRVVEMAVRWCVANRQEGALLPVRHPESSRFRPDGEPIGINESGIPGGQDVKVHLSASPAVWLRVLPKFDAGRRFLPAELKRVATQQNFPLVQLIEGYRDLGFLRGADGFGIFGMVGGRSETPAVSFAFDTGEIWSVDTYIISAAKAHAQGKGLPGIPYLEDRYKQALQSFRSMLTKLGLGPQFVWVAGVEGIKDCGIYFPAPAGQYFPYPIPHGPALVDKVWATGSLDETDTSATALKPFFLKMFGAFNVERPEYLDDVANPR
jgi:DNA-binding XRE family transcriptional regulator